MASLPSRNLNQEECSWKQLYSLRHMNNAGGGTKEPGYQGGVEIRPPSKENYNLEIAHIAA